MLHNYHECGNYAYRSTRGGWRGTNFLALSECANNAAHSLDEPVNFGRAALACANNELGCPGMLGKIINHHVFNSYESSVSCECRYRCRQGQARCRVCAGRSHLDPSGVYQYEKRNEVSGAVPQTAKDGRNRYQTLLLTPQKNGAGPCTQANPRNPSISGMRR